MSLSLIEVDSGLRLLLVKVDFRRYPCFWLSSQVVSRSGVDWMSMSGHMRALLLPVSRGGRKVHDRILLKPSADVRRKAFRKYLAIF